MPLRWGLLGGAFRGACRPCGVYTNRFLRMIRCEMQRLKQTEDLVRLGLKKAFVSPRGLSSPSKLPVPSEARTTSSYPGLEGLGFRVSVSLGLGFGLCVA